MSKRSPLLVALPLLLVMAVVAFLAVGLTLNPREVPSPLIGKAVPDFELPPIAGRQNPGLAGLDLKGEVSLVNVFASWCTACRYEHPLLMRLKRNGTIPVHGINYKDKPEDANAWLAELGDPYTRIGADRNGRISIDWGVYGVPETFLIDQQGRIAYKQIGEITIEAWEQKLWPLVQKLRAQKKEPRPQ